jgi:hypothetical protein
MDNAAFIMSQFCSRDKHGKQNGPHLRGFDELYCYFFDRFVPVTGPGIGANYLLCLSGCGLGVVLMLL